MRHLFATHASFAVLVWSTTSTLHFVPAGFISDAVVIRVIHLQQRLLSIALSRWDQMQQDKRLEPVPVRQVVSDHDYSYAQGTQ
jgi:hypothetical protein